SGIDLPVLGRAARTSGQPSRDAQSCQSTVVFSGLAGAAPLFPSDCSWSSHSHPGDNRSRRDPLFSCEYPRQAALGRKPHSAIPGVRTCGVRHTWVPDHFPCLDSNCAYGCCNWICHLRSFSRPKPRALVGVPEDSNASLVGYGLVHRRVPLPDSCRNLLPRPWLVLGLALELTCLSKRWEKSRSAFGSCSPCRAYFSLPSWLSHR